MPKFFRLYISPRETAIFIATHGALSRFTLMNHGTPHTVLHNTMPLSLKRYSIVAGVVLVCSKLRYWEAKAPSPLPCNATAVCLCCSSPSPSGCTQSTFTSTCYGSHLSCGNQPSFAELSPPNYCDGWISSTCRGAARLSLRRPDCATPDHHSKTRSSKQLKRVQTTIPQALAPRRLVSGCVCRLLAIPH